MKRNELPLFCYTTLRETGELVLIKQYEKGYFKTDYDSGDRNKNKEMEEFLNRKYGITPVQKEALHCGSLFGWHHSFTNPQGYMDKAVLDKSEMISGHIKDPVMSVMYPVKGNLYQYYVAGYKMHYLDLSALPAGYMGKDATYVMIPDLIQGIPLMPVRVKIADNGSYVLELENGCFSSEKEVNQSYSIIARVQVADVEYVMAENMKAPSRYVIWERIPANDEGGKKNYYLGNYLDERDSMIALFKERVQNKFQFNQKMKQKVQSEKER